ncbi:hypothetical protein PRIPAC_81643 [Pristionchus pacificus]|uniref:Uncharacterized protein n=1 Tax=Pristionchus pacificus TaxID=54126 RepID=A0A2A6BHL8_PRIPA|nr:hypothetical protein PRIPAC_81643 [Pristionchus pacificus]|eukprot:PDM65400.1 hypothetical protein PRIPAC_52342 [Pristionchus pacificus]
MKTPFLAKPSRNYTSFPPFTSLLHTRFFNVPRTMSEWSYEEINYNRRLHVITLAIALPIAVITYPLQLFTSYRLLTRKLTAPIYRLIVLNGTLGIFQFIVHLFTRQFPAFHEFSFIYEFLQTNRLEWIAIYITTFSYTVQIHCAFLIALNRFLNARSSSNHWLKSERAFRLSILFNLVFPLIFDASPSLLGNFHYVSNRLADGKVIYRPQLPYLISTAPPFLYGAVLAGLSYLFTGYIIFRLLSLRKARREHKVKHIKYSSSERGLALTSISTMSCQIIFVVFFMIMQIIKSKEAAAICIIPVTFNSAAPFWYQPVLLFTVPTVRKTLPVIECPRFTIEMSSTVSTSPRTTYAPKLERGLTI